MLQTLNNKEGDSWSPSLFIEYFEAYTSLCIKFQPLNKMLVLFKL